ncbi:MAG: hypothetical protein BECKG1743D_GA0114223_109123 [Candidatus Kentron sp. G]|nr:MAG: hypothetical protein BECKG1743F_GA0114225_108803 [Candidatus Kentron sp. G]VFN05372.1 MAG: hypothetical protein BECKG1743E_GA0114224_108563 [Candidatus Kentron sp. G]VFN06769.1 MAG: hypothetical protein BECKG1743D_GA0114223_109123 [Candidatus Kentron sp. G]
MKNGSDGGDDDFIEVHIYGPLSIKGVEAVHLRKAKASPVKIGALREKLKHLNPAIKVNSCE